MKIKNGVDMQKKLSIDQQDAINKIVKWFNYGKPAKQLLTIGGLAGTGKTFIIPHIIEKIRASVADPERAIAFVAFTGRATENIRSKIKDFGVINKFDATGTIDSFLAHTLVFEGKIDPKNPEYINRVFIRKTQGKQYSREDFCLIIIDEASMVDWDLYEKISSHQIPILAIGDHGQLSPIIVSNSKLKGLMDSPDIKLEKIHRQKEGSSAAIIKMAIEARATGKVSYGMIHEHVFKTDDLSLVERFADESWMWIAAFNKTATHFNNRIRSKFLGKNQTNIPITGEKLVCLLNTFDGIYNGQIGIVRKCSEYAGSGTEIDHYFKENTNEFSHIKEGAMKSFDGLAFKSIDECSENCLRCKYREKFLEIEIDFGDEEHPNIKTVKCFKPQLHQMKVINNLVPFEMPNFRPSDLGYHLCFGYAITCHKAQGIESKNVVVLEENRTRGWLNSIGIEYEKWLYTAITRATEKIIILDIKGGV